MYTYTFPYEHFTTMMNHMMGLSITVENLTLTDNVYTIVCSRQIDQEQYDHLHEQIGLMEVV